MKDLFHKKVEFVTGLLGQRNQRTARYCQEDYEPNLGYFCEEQIIANIAHRRARDYHYSYHLFEVHLHRRPLRTRTYSQQFYDTYEHPWISTSS